MTTYQSKIKQTQDGDFYAMVVQVDYDGQESVTPDYKPRHFKTMAAAQKSTEKYIAQI